MISLKTYLPHLRSMPLVSLKSCSLSQSLCLMLVAQYSNQVMICADSSVTSAAFWAATAFFLEEGAMSLYFCFVVSTCSDKISCLITAAIRSAFASSLGSPCFSAKSTKSFWDWYVNDNRILPLLFFLLTVPFSALCRFSGF